jgi:putative tricarboxylic transport membrane protein
MKLSQDRVAGAILLLICTGLFYEGWRYPADSRLFPLGLLAFLMIGAIVMIVRPAPASKGERGEPKKVLLTTLLCVAYVALVEVLGFYVATALFMAVFMAMMGLRKPVIYIAAIVGVNLGIYLLFVWQLKVPVPIGILFQ